MEEMIENKMDNFDIKVDYDLKAKIDNQNNQIRDFYSKLGK